MAAPQRQAPVPESAPTGRARVEFARTADAWDIALHRYRGQRRDLPPLIICPGYACNRHFVDFDERYSLARFCARRGFDTWVLELRGRGYSEAVFGGGSRGWNFDDLVRFDVPAAIAYVRGRCEERRPVWIGHSMGGMVVYAALGQDPELGKSLSGLVTIASPVGFPAVASPLARGLGSLLLALPLPQRLPQRSVLVALWSVMAHSGRFPEVGMNRRNLDQAAFGRALPLFMCNVARAKVQQFTRWSLTGQFRSNDGATDYRANLSRITTAALIIAGAADQLAPPETVGLAFDRLGSAEKLYREFARRQQDSADYGHVDLIFGRRAPEEVFPTISDWIENGLSRR
ncbi:MAG: alpha/beta fold hydrolase [Deltaproteobacteria bacterium]|nr:alpha/beta fold hydrolase [Deltaproteobacteria bacterium]